MSGFDSRANKLKKPTNVKANSIKDKEVKVDSPDLSVDDEEFEDLPNEDDEDSLQQSVLQSKKLIIVAGVVVGIILFVLTVNMVVGTIRDSREEIEPVQQSEVQEEEVVEQLEPKDEPNQNKDNIGTDEGSYTENIQPSRVEPVWDLLSSQQIKDFCNYEKHRSVMGNGLELYWLNCVYKEMSYTIQVDYATYSMLEEKGIVPVIAEEVTTVDSVKVITYMEVDTDYLRRLKK